VSVIVFSSLITLLNLIGLIGWLGNEDWIYVVNPCAKTIMFLYFVMSVKICVFGWIAFYNVNLHKAKLVNDSTSMRVNLIIYMVFAVFLAILWFFYFVFSFIYVNIAFIYLTTGFTGIQMCLLCFIVGGEAFNELINDTAGSPAVYSNLIQQPIPAGAINVHQQPEKGIVKLSEQKPGV
jgi:hypothetical protein